MIEYKKKIAQKTLSTLKKKSWNSFSFEQILKTYRFRCRPNFTGAFDGYDCALIQKFADAFDIDDSSNYQ